MLLFILLFVGRPCHLPMTDPVGVWPSPLEKEGRTTCARDDAEDNDIETVRQAAKGAEIHAIGVSEPVVYLFKHEDVTNWPQMVDLLRRKEGPAGRIWELLPKRTQDLVADDKIVGQLALQRPTAEAIRLKGSVASGVKKLLSRTDFYTEKVFKDVPLDKNLKDSLALGEKRTYLQTLRMNRELLAQAFPNVVSAVSTDYHVVRVLVKSGKPVVLVLAAYTACQWQIEVEEGGQVVGIILGGTEPQEVTGVKAPVVYRAGTWPDGKDRWGRGGETIWTSYDRNDKSFAQFEAGAKKITGKTLTQFQGKYNAPKEGFVVKPSAK